MIGSRIIILKGVKIGEGAVVRALSLVTKSILPYAVNVGNLCKPSKCKFNKIDLERYLIIAKSIYSTEDLIKQYDVIRSQSLLKI